MNSPTALPPIHNVTADDWGFSPAINDGILELVKKGAIRRVSLMATQPYLAHRLGELLACGIELGLHFNLTHANALNPIPAGWSLHPLRWFFAGRVRKRVATESLRLQLKTLRENSIPVRYLDGHHHIHLILGWLPEADEVLREFGVRHVRIPFDRRMIFTKRAPIALLALLAKRHADRLGLAYLPFYYPSLRELDDTARLSRFIADHPQTEIIVHPAERIDAEFLREGDGYLEGRTQEYRALRKLAAPKGSL